MNLYTAACIFQNWHHCYFQFQRYKKKATKMCKLEKFTCYDN